MDIGESFQNTTDRIFEFIPNILGFLLVLLIGWIIAKIAQSAVRKLLQKLDLDQKLQSSDSSRYVDAVLPGASPSAGIAQIVFWLILLFFFVNAVSALKLEAATDFTNRVLAFLPNIIVAIVIFVVAALLAGAVATLAAKLLGDTPTGKIAATVVPALVMVIALFMILEQLQIAPEIIRIAFAAVMFALSLGLALAFGLGGREVAAELLNSAKEKSTEAKRQAKEDLETGKRRAEDRFGQPDQQFTTGPVAPRTM